MVLNVDTGKTAGVRDTDKRFVHMRHIGDLSERRAWEGFVQVEKNRFTRLSSRALLGGGLRWGRGQDDHDRTQAVVGLGAFTSHEKLEPREDTTDAGEQRLWRAHSYLVIRYRFNENVVLQSTTYYQPATSDLSDFRAMEQASLQVRLNEQLDLKLSLDVAHDSRPPQLVKKTDVTYRAGLEYQF